MILSRNEVAATLHKAARGQGMPLGHADVFVPAAVRALGLYADLADQVTKALKGPHACTQTRVAMAGPIAIDALKSGAAEVLLTELDCPKIMVAMVYNARDTSHLRAILHFKKDCFLLQRVDTIVVPAQTIEPLDIPDPAWSLWQSWAALTYVPESAESRLSGAGAGLTDND